MKNTFIGGPLKLPRIKAILVLGLTLMSTIPILTFGLSQAFRWRDFTKATDESEAISQVQSLHQELKRVLDIRLSALELMAEQIRLQTGIGPLKASKLSTMLELYVEKFEMQTAGIADLDGNNIELYNHVASKIRPLKKINIKSMGYIDAVLEKKQSVITTVRKGLLTGRTLFVLATPIWDHDRKNIRAVIASSVFTDEIQQISKRILANTPLFEFQVLDQDDNIVAETGQAPAAFEVRKEGGSILTSPVTDVPQIRTGEDLTGRKLHGAIRRLQIRPGIEWTLLVTQSLESLHRNERIAWSQVFLVAIVGVGSSFVIALLISSFISKPILDLISNMKGIENGEIFQIEPPEAGALAFKETQEAWEALATMTRKINDYTFNLEAEVNQRTQELIKTHRELDEQRSRAIESSRLASLGEMAGGIAHEINNPLSIISLITQKQRDLIDKNEYQVQDIRDAFSRIDATTFRIAKIIQGLRKFSREGGKDPLEKASLNSIVDSTLTLCHEKFKQNKIQIRVIPAEQDYSLFCRPIQISQVLLNLLSNAFDAIQNQTEKWIEIRIQEVNGLVEIRVTDSGSGIDTSLQEKIFQPFFTLKEIGKGTGLGLSISKGIIESHQGQIFVDSQEAHTSFAIHLPMA